MYYLKVQWVCIQVTASLETASGNFNIIVLEKCDVYTMQNLVIFYNTDAHIPVKNKASKMLIKGIAYCWTVSV